MLLNMSHNHEELRERVQAAVQELADRGFRSLGVAITCAHARARSWENAFPYALRGRMLSRMLTAVRRRYTGQDEPPMWEFQGVLSLFDPPRSDTKQTIETALAMGVEVKMVTGDHTAIAKARAARLRAIGPS